MTASRQASPDTDGVMCAKGTVNILEDLVCQDYVCLTVNRNSHLRTIIQTKLYLNRWNR